MTSLVQLTRDAETISPGGLQTGVNPSDLLTDQPIQEMAPSIRRIRKALCAHLVATRHARVERIFGNVDTQYPVDHCPILPLRIFSKSSASNNLVRRIYACACPRIRSDLNSGAWKTGPNLPHRLIAKGTKEAHRSPRCSAKRVHSLSSLCNVQGTCVSSRAPRKDPYVRFSRLRLVWGFLCQGASHIFVAVTSIFCSTRKHSSVSTADNHRRRATRVEDGAS